MVFEYAILLKSDSNRLSNCKLENNKDEKKDENFDKEEEEEGILYIHSKYIGNSFLLRRVPRFPLLNKPAAVDAEGKCVAPMPGTILKLLKKDGDSVVKGDTLLVMESMKMETKIAAGKSGSVKILVKEGQMVNAGTVLVVIQ